MTYLSAYMYQQIYKCTDKTPKKHYWGGGEQLGNCPLPPPPPSGYASDHTNYFCVGFFFSSSFFQLTASPVFQGVPASAGKGGLLPLTRNPEPFFFESLYFGPRASGASAHSNQWYRNKYTWNGSYYYVYAK